MSDVPEGTVQEVDQTFQDWYARLNKLVGRRITRLGVKAQNAKSSNEDELAEEFEDLDKALKEFQTLAVDVKRTLDEVGTAIKNAPSEDREPEQVKRWKTYVAEFASLGNDVKVAYRKEKTTTDKTGGVVSETAAEIRGYYTKLVSLGAKIKVVQSDFSPEETQRRQKLHEAAVIREQQKIAELQKYENELVEYLTRQPQANAIATGKRLSDEQLATQLESLHANGSVKYSGLDQAGAIMAEHRSKVPAEQAAFFGKDRMEDVLTLVGQLRVNVTERNAMLDKMKQAKDDALARHDRLQKALEKTSQIARDVLESALTGRELMAYDQIRSFGTVMLHHIPQDYREQTAKFDDRISNLLRASDSGERDKMKKEAVEELLQARKGEADKFKEAVSKHSGLDPRRFDSYFNQLNTPLAPKEMKELMGAIDAAVKRAHKVRDAGGSVAKVEQQLAHIPRNFWPIEFVLELEGWRKVERAMLEEAVDDMMKEAAKKSLWQRATSVGSNSKAFFDLALSALPQKDDDDTPQQDKFLSEDFNKSLGILGDIQNAAQGIEVIYSTFKDAKELEHVVAWLNDRSQPTFQDYLQEKREDIQHWAANGLVGKAEKVGEYCDKISTGMGHIASYSSAVADTLGDYALPGISLALGIKDFGIAAAKHIGRGREKEGTHKLFDRAQRERATKVDMAHYEGLEDAFLNHERQMDRLRSGHRHEMVVAGVKVAKGGAEIAATATGVAAPAAYGVKAGILIVEKAIVYGGKIYFANVDFNAAQRARKTLEEARAGNRVAQLQVFADNGRYAKMLIAIMVKDEDPLAIEFIVQRGFRDRDLDKPENSAMVLRRWMMKGAEQTDERDAPTTRKEANVGAVFGKTPKRVLSAMSSVKDQCQVWHADAKVKWEGKPYNRDWKPPAVALTQDAWSTAKQGAIDSGLFPKDTGLSKALGKLHNSLEALGVSNDFTIKGVKSLIAQHRGPNLAPNPDPVPGIRQKKLIQAVLDAAREVDMLVGDYDPMHVPMSKDGTKVELGGEVDRHMPMVEYLVMLRSEANSVGNAMEQLLEGITKTPAITDYDSEGKLDISLIDGNWLVGEPVRDMTWTHVDSEVALTAAAWKTATETALKKAWLDEAGGGDKAVLKLRDEVTKALRAYESAAANATDLDSLSGQDARKVRQAKYGALQQVIDAMKAYWKDCGHNGIRAYLDALTNTAGKELHALDMALFPDAPPSVEDRIAACRIVLAALPRTSGTGVSEKSEKRLWDIETRKDTDAYDTLMQDLNELAKDLKELGTTAKLPDTAIASLELPTGTFSLTVVRGKPGPQHFHPDVWKKACDQCVTAGVMDAGAAADEVWLALKGWDSAQSKYRASVDITPDNAGHEVHSVKYLSGDTQEVKDKKNREAQEKRFEVRKALTKVFVEASKFAAQVHTPAMRDYVNFIILHAQQLNAAVLKVQSGVKFDVDYRFTQEAWNTSYANAVNAGAVVADRDRSKRLETALSEFESTNKDMAKRTNRGETRVVAYRLVKLLNEVSLAASEVARTEGYLDNELMVRLLETYQAEVVTRTGNDPISGLIDGSGSMRFDPGPFHYDNAAWQEVKKLAIADGILDGRKTGFGKQLETSDKAYSKLLAARRGGSTSPKQLAKLRIEALAQLDMTEKVALTLKASSKNAKFGTYISQCQEIIKQRREDLGDTGTFKGFPFQMDNNHWQTVKAVAVNAGLLTDAKTGFGTALTATSKAFNAFYTEKLAKKDTTDLVQPLTTAIERTRGKVTELRSQVNDANFQRYLDECLALLDQYANLVSGGQDKLLELPNFAFTKGTWTDAKDRAVSAGVLTRAKTGMGPAIKDAAKAYSEWMDETEDNNSQQRVTDLQNAISEVKVSVQRALNGATCNSLKLFIQQFEDVVDNWNEQIDAMDDELPSQAATETAEWLPTQYAAPQLTVAEWNSVVKEAKRHGWAPTRLPVRKDFVALERALKSYNDAPSVAEKTSIRPTVLGAYQTLIADLGKLKNEARYDSKWDKNKGEHPGMKRFAERLITKATEGSNSL